MVRGRKPDPTAPLSRSLLSQRDYRARKAQYVSDLEEKCKRLEEENERLVKEVQSLREELSSRDNRIMLPSHLISEAALVDRAQALTGVLGHLSAAITSIQEFQYATLGSHLDTQSQYRYPPLSIASLAEIPPLSSVRKTEKATSSRPHPEPVSSEHLRTVRDDWDPESPHCCGGILDCRGLTDDRTESSSEHGEKSENETTPTSEYPAGLLRLHRQDPSNLPMSDLQQVMSSSSSAGLAFGQGDISEFRTESERQSHIRTQFD
ncbi:hypothetical protein VKT23_013832 [Stygiomarasmius scandens]|uniref:BZIP domain-containing protein n=1 Tax=Marasmiellus scandens TaxID=2682957 RepID=A0ABR1J1Z2_9AGAR